MCERLTYINVKPIVEKIKADFSNEKIKYKTYTTICITICLYIINLVTNNMACTVH